jgi:ssDNA-binding Zn-finger/Zn-ribbon topoisomerase 1
VGRGLFFPRPARTLEEDGEMSIKNRIQRLEEGDAERCLACKLRPKKTFVINPGEEDNIPEPERCPECGSAIELIVLRLVYEDVEGEGEPY